MTVDQKNQEVVINHIRLEMESDIDSIQFQIRKLIANFESKFTFLKINGITLVRLSTLSTEKEQLSININVALALKNMPVPSFIEGGIVTGNHNSML